MPHFLRPNADYSNSGWTSTDPGSLFPTIAEEVLDETHNLSAFGSFTEAEVRFNLPAPPSTPVSGITCNARCYAAKLQELGDFNAFEIRLWVGPSLTLVTSQSFTLTTTNTLLSMPFLSQAVSDWTNLVIGFYRAPTLSGNQAVLFQAFLEIPGFAHLDANGPGFITAPVASGNSLAASGPGFSRLSGAEATGAIIDLAGGFVVRA